MTRTNLRPLPPAAKVFWLAYFIFLIGGALWVF
jgi:hypothetical protein